VWVTVFAAVRPLGSKHETLWANILVLKTVDPDPILLLLLCCQYSDGRCCCQPENSWTQKGKLKVL
jgi:hypothetical protein